MKQHAAALPVDQAEEVFDLLQRFGGAHPRARGAFLADTAKLSRATVFMSSGTTLDVYLTKTGWYAELASPDDFSPHVKVLLDRVNGSLDQAYRKFN